MQVALSDGRKLALDVERATVRDVAEQISAKLAKKAVGGRVNGVVCDLAAEVVDGDEVTVLTLGDADGLWLLRHSAAHVMAAAVKRLFPDAKLGIGPPIQDGFYYDFDLQHRLTDGDLAQIEAEMAKVVAEDVPFVREDLPRERAFERLRDQGEDYKIELVEKDLAAEQALSFYVNGEFKDLCRGPHAPSTGWVKVAKLLSVSGSYWKGRETNPTLQRIYGTAWRDKRDLKSYLHWREQAKKRDHRRIGRDLGLYSFHLEAPGMAFWHPKGTVVFNQLMEFFRETHGERGYQEVRTPLVMDEELWRRSGHWDNYKENMFFTESEARSFAIKPMNCPGHCLIYAQGLRSYRDLPLRFAEAGQVHRNEKSGTLHGLFRVRTFTQDDAHIYCTPDQIEDEIVEVLSFMKDMYAALGFDEYRVELSTRPENSIGSDEIWRTAERALEVAIARDGSEFQLNPGDGAFYGPKLDFHITDCVGRSWQCGTVQLDFSMPARFGLEYVGADNQKHTPVMIHRALYGSIERTIGILVEHFAGALPVWLAPVQATVLPITDAHVSWAMEVQRTLCDAGLRIASDVRNLKVGKKVREAALQKIPYQLVVGQREVEARTVSVRARGNKDLGAMEVGAVRDKLTEEVRTRFVEPVECWRRPSDPLYERKRGY
ncbi:threonine--tRNA ligase [Planctomycetota bacterium]